MTLIELCGATPCHPRSDSLSLLASGVFGRAEMDLRKVFRSAANVQPRAAVVLARRLCRRLPAPPALLAAAALLLALEGGEQWRAHRVHAALGRSDRLDPVGRHGPTPSRRRPRPRGARRRPRA